MQIEQSSRTEELSGAPLADVIHAVAMAVADGQFQLDKASLRAAEYMSGRMLLRDVDTGLPVSGEGRPSDTPASVDTRILFGYAYDQGKRVENRLSMIELGFVPSFYQFVDTVIDMKLTLRLRRHQAESGMLAVAAEHRAGGATGRSRGSRPRTVITTTPVDARYSNSYGFSAEMASRVKTKIVPVPPPSILEERIRALMEQDRERMAVESARRGERSLSANPLGGPDFAEDRCYEIGDVEAAKGLATRAFTVEAWVCPRAIFGDRAAFALWTDDGTDARGWLLGVSDAQFVFRLTTYGAPGETALRSPAAVVPEIWQHLAAVYDGTQMRLYVDGKLQNGSAEQSGDILYPTQGRLLIGADESPHGKPFGGRIDDVRLWNRARTSAEIADNKDYRLEGHEPGLMGYWRLDRCKDEVVPDETGGEHRARRCSR